MPSTVEKVPGRNACKGAQWIDSVRLRSLARRDRRLVTVGWIPGWSKAGWPLAL